jgi:hypothetical protein
MFYSDLYQYMSSALLLLASFCRIHAGGKKLAVPAPYIWMNFIKQKTPYS